MGRFMGRFAFEFGKYNGTGRNPPPSIGLIDPLLRPARTHVGLAYLKSV